MAIAKHSTILVVDDEESVRKYLFTILSSKYKVLLASNESKALSLLSEHRVDLILLDLLLEEHQNDGLDFMDQVLDAGASGPKVVIITGITSVPTVVSAMQKGASDYLSKPLRKEDVLLTVSAALEKRALEKRNQVLEEEVKDQFDATIIAQSECMQKTLTAVERLQHQAVNICLFGETGTGKERLARKLWHQENEPNRPFVTVHCASLPKHLAESILFGHEKNPEQGFMRRRIGKFELADGGDLFLDEIACLNPEIQSKILQVIESQELERLGGQQAIKLSFRSICASNLSEQKLLASGFREDLFFRLNTVSIEIPPLRNRKEDILPLAKHFLANSHVGGTEKVFTEKTIALLEGHSWPGNVRELRNTVENMMIFGTNQNIEPNDIPFRQQQGEASLAPEGAYLGDKSYEELMQDFERNLILDSLKRNRWSKTKTSKDLGISRSKLYRKMTELNL